MNDVASVIDESLVELARALLAIPPGRRGSVIRLVFLCQADMSTVAESIEVRALRKLLAEYWSNQFHEALPKQKLNLLVEAPHDIATLIEFGKLMLVGDQCEMQVSLFRLVAHVRHLTKCSGDNQPVM